MTSEYLLNSYYNRGGFNKPERIGYMMKMIRELHPLTEEEWYIWYVENVHDESYIDAIAEEMYRSIPQKLNISKDECYNYIKDVMFRRTFNGYNKEKLALNILRNSISPTVQEAPKEWDTSYFIDFYLRGANNILIGIQLKPATFFYGHYQNIVDIKGKMKQFCEDYSAQAFILIYLQDADSTEITFENPQVINDIKNLL